MEQWVFYPERKENGRDLLFAKNLSDKQIYRWEPIMTRLTGDETGRLRRAIRDCAWLLHQFDTLAGGIVQVHGPFLYRDEYWLAWPNRAGESLFGKSANPAFSLGETVEALYPLIQDYAHYHQSGIIVGQPNWGKIFRDFQGIYMIAPAHLLYLEAQEFYPPPGLLACKPAEAYEGVALNQSGDLFYLGLIIYYAICTRLPFILHKQWPTKALLKGDVIPPVVFCPALHPFLADMMNHLLNPKPEKRGTAAELEVFWRLMLKDGNYSAGSQAILSNNKQQKAFYRNKQLHKLYRPGLAIAVALLTFFIGRLLLLPVLAKEQQFKISPLQVVKHFYKAAAGPPQSAADFQLNPLLVRDFHQARENRLQTAAELLLQPLVTVKRMKVISQTNRRLVVEVFINQWERKNDSWQNRPYREMITLGRKGNQWVVIGRKKYKNS